MQLIRLRALLLLAVLPGPLAAQADDAIPRELVMALLARTGPYLSSGSLLVGRAPPDFPAALLPPGAVLLGSLASDDQSSSTVIFRMAESPDEARKTVEALLVNNGWQGPPGPPQRKGFISGVTAYARGMFCKERGAVINNSYPRSAGGSVVAMLFLVNPGMTACSRPEVTRREWDADVPIPGLLPPPGLNPEGGGGGGGGGNDRWDYRTMLRGHATAPDVLRHYTDQLTVAGWTADPPASGGPMAAQLLRLTTDSASWMATLLVTTLKEELLSDALLSVRKLVKRPK